MKICKEMQEVIDDLVPELEENQIFKKQFKNLLENYYQNSAADETIQRVIEKIQFDEV
ncbi:hypothetical protein [Hungatella hathewayi]|uniref:hypothetical protein n=1 Tax=Hungatella hathewayi TaxID=154046 RepID=UPI00165233DA|nr:hypothetical protein [Hungatella hathewayi]